MTTASRLTALVRDMKSAPLDDRPIIVRLYQQTLDELARYEQVPDGIRKALDRVGTALCQTSSELSRRRWPIYSDPKPKVEKIARKIAPAPVIKSDPNGVCLECDSKIVGKKKNARYCTDKCAKAAEYKRSRSYRERMAAYDGNEGRCIECGGHCEDKDGKPDFFVNDEGEVRCRPCHVRNDLPLGDVPVHAGRHYGGTFHVALDGKLVNADGEEYEAAHLSPSLVQYIDSDYDERDPRLVALSILLDPKRSSALLPLTRALREFGREIGAERNAPDEWWIRYRSGCSVWQRLAA